MASAGRTFLVAGKRTPFGKFGGSLAAESPVALSVKAVQAALAAAHVKDPASTVGHVVCGNVIPSTTDTVYAARHVALKTGCHVSVPAINLNRLCGSGLEAISDARHRIERGDMAEGRPDVAVAFGVENMSMIPHLVYGARFGTRYGALNTVDFLLDTLTDKHTGDPMAITAENLGGDYSISRAECDQHALESHNKAAAAYAAGHMQGELVSYELKKAVVSQDEHVRYDCTLEDMSKLKSVFKKDGTVTAATASGVVDGAAAVVVASERYCDANGITPLAEIKRCEVVGVDPTRMGIGPAPAIRQLLAKSGLSLEEIDFIEINEAFSSQLLACAKELKLDRSKLNVWGGAVAIGHPLGGSGIRLALTLSRQLNILGGTHGIAAACIGGGQGIAMHLKKYEK